MTSGVCSNHSANFPTTTALLLSLKSVVFYFLAWVTRLAQDDSNEILKRVLKCK